MPPHADRRLIGRFQLLDVDQLVEELERTRPALDRLRADMQHQLQVDEKTLQIVFRI